jgi:hypothetical protein
VIQLAEVAHGFPPRMPEDVVDAMIGAN